MKLYIILLLCVLSVSVRGEDDAQCIPLKDRPSCPQACQFNCSSLYTGFLLDACQSGLDLCLQEFAIAYNHLDRCNNDCMIYCLDKRPPNATEVDACFNANCLPERDTHCKLQCGTIYPTDAAIASCKANVDATVTRAVTLNTTTCNSSCGTPQKNACRYGSICPYGTADRQACIDKCLAAIDTSACTATCYSNAVAYFQAMYKGEYDHCLQSRSATASELAACTGPCAANYDFTACRGGCQAMSIKDDSYRQQCRKDCRQADYDFYGKRCARFTDLATDFVKNATEKRAAKA